MSVVVGIDPGVTGALALFQGGRLEWVADLPTYDGRVDGIELSAMLDVEVDVVYLENTHPMPRNGSIASYKLGLNTGIIIGVVQAMAIPLTRISVSAWRNWNGLGRASKDASRGLARELFPHLADELRLAKHHNRAEAVLIGRYGVYRQIHNAQTGVDDNDESATVSDLLGVDRHPAGGSRRRVAGATHRAQSSTAEEQ